jgi:hypothetical protein
MLQRPESENKMSLVTQFDIEQQEKERQFQEAKNRALDFSEAHASIARAEVLLEKAKRLLEPPTADPRTPEEIALDAWQAEWRETYQSLREDMR